MIREISVYSRMVSALYQWVRMPMVADPKALVGQNVRNREANFLDLMQRAVFNHPPSPYHTLFKWAGCTYGDLENGVKRDGLETTLESLRQAGVYVSHDEFKGKVPIKRGNLELAVDSNDFANPLVKGMTEVASSGSRSRGTLTLQSYEYQFYREAQDCVMYEPLGYLRAKLVRMSSILPSSGGIKRAIYLTRRGVDLDRWFALGGTWRDSARYRLLTQMFIAEARLLGVKAPFPSFLPQNDFSPVAKRIAQIRAAGTECLFSAGTSNAVRVAAAASAEGLDISGTTFRVHGEALTDPKRAVIEKTGCNPYSGYTISEVGKIGTGCTGMDQGNCVHVCKDTVAVISYRRKAPLTDVELDSLMVTNLIQCGPMVVVNAEMDDAGVLGPATCNCELKAMGFDQQISDIFSFGKLTGQGVTLIVGDLLDLVESRLPARFGGAPTDYQLVEYEGAFQTEVELRVHPRLGIVSENDVQAFFMAELAKVFGGSLSRRNWSQTQGVRIAFVEPHRSGDRGKVHPLHLLGTTSHTKNA